MCHKCHQHISHEDAIVQLQEVTADPRFEMWNTTLIYHIFQFALGSHGPQARVLSLEILNKFYKWYADNKTDGYLPRCGLQRMIPLATICSSIGWLEHYDTDENKCLSQRLEEFEAFLVQQPQQPPRRDRLSLPVYVFSIVIVVGLIGGLAMYSDIL
jgi:hypothetical protein